PRMSLEGLMQNTLRFAELAARPGGSVLPCLAWPRDHMHVMGQHPLPAKLASDQYVLMSIEAIRSDFALLDDWEDRYRYVIELGRTLDPLSDALRTETNKVRGCASQVWLATSSDQAPGSQPRLHFVGDSDAHIVRGLIAI